jgi:hypothetical protein
MKAFTSPKGKLQLSQEHLATRMANEAAHTRYTSLAP